MPWCRDCGHEGHLRSQCQYKQPISRVVQDYARTGRMPVGRFPPRCECRTESTLARFVDDAQRLRRQVVQDQRGVTHTWNTQTIAPDCWSNGPTPQIRQGHGQVPCMHCRETFSHQRRAERVE